ncbi:hypothetical protein T484DRAFT_1772013 [Baffinella frigidus]|nr:hypothetical protein T484DRAFT_1772013 [Cryptophyta sp. CCMP2293]
MLNLSLEGLQERDEVVASMQALRAGEEKRMRKERAQKEKDDEKAERAAQLEAAKQANPHANRFISAHR